MQQKLLTQKDQLIMCKRPPDAANYKEDKARGLTYSYEQDKRNINWGNYEEDKARGVVD